MLSNWYRRARDEQLDLFEEPEVTDEPEDVKEEEEAKGKEEKPSKEGPDRTCHLMRAFKEDGGYYVMLQGVGSNKFYAYWIDPPSKWLDHPKYHWDYWLRTINQKNPNKLWSYVEKMAIKGWEVTREWPHNIRESEIRELEIKK